MSLQFLHFIPGHAWPLNSDTRAVLETHVLDMMQDKTLYALWAWTVHWEIIYCRKKQKELTVSRAQMSETENGTNRVELSSCTLPDFEKRAPKTFYHDDQTITCRRICKGEQSLTSENDSFGDVCRSMCTLQRPFTFGSHQLTFDLKRCFSFWKCMQMVKAGCSGRELVWKQFQTVQAPGGRVRLSWQACGAARTLHASC